MASLLTELVISGSRKSDGTANASGKVYAYIPGTSTSVPVYSSSDASTIATQPLTLDSGGRINRTDYPSGIWVTRPVRLLIQDSAGSTVSDSTYYPATANNVAMDNDGFTGTTVDEALDAAYTSTGGQDFKYLESAGATARTIKAKFSELGISVKDFGAVGDGVTVDTSAIQQAMNRAKVLSVPVMFPGGTYKIDQALALTSATGVSLIGAGSASAIISNTHATGNAFTLTSCTGFRVEGLAITNATAGTNTGIGLSLVSCSNVIVTASKITEHGTGISITGTAPGNIIVTGGTIVEAAAIGANARGIMVNPTTSPATGTKFAAIGCNLSGAGNSSSASIEFAGSANHCTVTGCTFYGAANVRFDSALTGTNFYIFSNSYPSGLAQVIEAATEPSALLTDVTNNATTETMTGTGTATTPDRSRFNLFRINVTGAGATITIPAPTPIPSADSDAIIRFRLYNNNAGATTYTFNAVYHLASAISTTAGNQTEIELHWDWSRSIWVEAYRAVTT